MNARAIHALGDWIPGVINFSGLKGSQAEKDKIRQIYRELGLNMQGSIKGEEASIPPARNFLGQCIGNI